MKDLGLQRLVWPIERPLLSLGVYLRRDGQRAYSRCVALFISLNSYAVPQGFAAGRNLAESEKLYLQLGPLPHKRAVRISRCLSVLAAGSARLCLFKQQNRRLVLP